MMKWEDGMKEIKFRYRIKHKSGNIHTHHFALDAIEKGIANKDNLNIGCKILSRDRYIGIKDKNGNEEYHKDIVEFCGFRYVIEWDDRRACFYGRQIRIKHTPYTGGIKSAQFFRQCKIIGNMHDNPELLEDKNVKRNKV